MLRCHRTFAPSLLLCALLAAPAATVTAQQFQAGAVYLMGPALHLPPNQTYAGIRRVDPVTGITTAFVSYQNAAGISQGGISYDPFRDRIVTVGQAPQGPFGTHAIDAAGNWTLLSPGALQRLAPRGDGKIYGYRQAFSPTFIPRIHYLDVQNQEQTLLDVGGAAPWGIDGGNQVFGDPIRAMIYEPSENALFLALSGDATTPGCGGPANFRITLRKLPLTQDGTALRAAPVCTTFDMTNQAFVTENPLGFSYGPQGTLVLAAAANTSGAMARFLSIDPVTAVATPFAIVGPYTGDIGFSCGAYCPTIGRALTLDGGIDAFRSYHYGESGSGTVFGSFGSPGFGGGAETLFVIGPIGPQATLTANTFGLSTATGGIQNLRYAPGQAFAGNLYFILGSISGWSPGTALGAFTLPINWDVYTNLMVSNPNSAFFVNTLGGIGGNGETNAQIVLPGGMLTALQGVTIHHAGLCANAALQFVHVSNPVPLVLLP